MTKSSDVLLCFIFASFLRQVPAPHNEDWKGMETFPSLQKFLCEESTKSEIIARLGKLGIDLSDVLRAEAFVFTVVNTLTTSNSAIRLYDVQFEVPSLLDQDKNQKYIPYISFLLTISVLVSNANLSGTEEFRDFLIYDLRNVTKSYLWHIISELREVNLENEGRIMKRKSALKTLHTAPVGGSTFPQMQELETFTLIRNKVAQHTEKAADDLTLRLVGKSVDGPSANKPDIYLVIYEMNTKKEAFGALVEIREQECKVLKASKFIDIPTDVSSLVRNSPPLQPLREWVDLIKNTDAVLSLQNLKAVKDREVSLMKKKLSFCKSICDSARKMTIFALGYDDEEQGVVQYLTSSWTGNQKMEKTYLLIAAPETAECKPEFVIKTLLVQELLPEKLDDFVEEFRYRTAFQH